MTIQAHTRTRPDSGYLPAVQEAHIVAPAMMTRLPWSEHPITFNEFNCFLKKSFLAEETHKYIESHYVWRAIPTKHFSYELCNII